MKSLLSILLLIPSVLYGQYVVDSTASLRGISVLDQNVVWVSGSHGTLAKTEDGGENWNKITIPNTEHLDFRDVEVFSKDEVLVMSAGEGELSNVFKTYDGGKSWQKVYANKEEKGFFNGFAFNDAGQGVLTGDPIGGKLVVLKSNNRGDKWKLVNSNKLPLMAEGEAGGFAASGSHLYLGDDFFVNGTGGRVSRLLIADARLNFWKAVYVPMMQGEASQGIFSVDFFGQEGIIVGGDYTKVDEGESNVFITSDGGEVWVAADNFPPFQSSVRFIDTNRIISTGPAGCYLSEDAGFTWRKLDLSGFHTLDIGSDGSIWAAGSSGRVMKINI